MKDLSKENFIKLTFGKTKTIKMAADFDVDDFDIPLPDLNGWSNYVTEKRTNIVSRNYIMLCHADTFFNSKKNWDNPTSLEKMTFGEYEVDNELYIIAYITLPNGRSQKTLSKAHFPTRARYFHPGASKPRITLKWLINSMEGMETIDHTQTSKEKLGHKRSSSIVKIRSHLSKLPEEIIFDIEKLIDDYYEKLDNAERDKGILISKFVKEHRLHILDEDGNEIDLDVESELVKFISK